MPILRGVLLALLALLAFLPTITAAQTPEVAPGVTLPSSAVSIVDKESDGKIKAMALHSAVVVTDPHTGSNIAKGLVYANQHQSIQLAGKSSANTMQSDQPSFYVHMPDDQRDLMRAQLTLVRMKPTADTRIVLEFKANAFGGHRKRAIDSVPIEKSDVQGGTWVKITPSQPLTPGEYGLMFLPQDPYAFSMTVYDISIPAR
jgi:hypothetical protein